MVCLHKARFLRLGLRNYSESNLDGTRYFKS